ncbi:hypothetical protein JOC85_003616 [Bacillus mesophilus]|uniref:Uncharacterized protein n=1 Tax=Bacillus mesophilus TaxID=1808955 RepID=A0A6M0QAM5_9BACI|nr:hypothetical protein [Bacillus mesophilus]MBM7662805.1 hypothetical protein [Bacillus mesophilus]NEY73396.1 hypothetical protein [Bacillus mesophilus]
MDIFEYLDELQVDLRRKSLNEIEEKYFNVCSELAGADRANTIKQLDLNEYVNDLKLGLKQSLKIAQEQTARAIYFEYDLDNNWDSAFFICDEYNRLEDEDDDWASDWSEDFEGPSLEQFANIYELDGFDGDNVAIGSTIYLVARTVSAFKTAYKSLSDESSIAVCIAFHDQDPIIRIKE